MSETSDSDQITTTVAIVSDTHTWLDPRIIDIVAGADIAIHAGDVGNADVLSSMRPSSGKIVAVIGNNDQPFLWPSDQRDTLESLSEIETLDLPGGRIAIEHGDRHDSISPSHKSLRDAHPDARLIVYGHTHHMTIDDEVTPWVVNPGAAGSTRTRGGPSCLLLTASHKKWQIESFRFSETADS